MKLRAVVTAGAAILISTCVPRPALTQWNSYDAMMSNNSFSRGWVNPYNNTFTHAYDAYTYKPVYLNNYFASSSFALRGQTASATAEDDVAAADVGRAVRQI